jgi:hypothetical protein
MTDTFSDFYDSVWQHPYGLWLAGALGLAYALTRPGLHPSVKKWAIGLAALSGVDAWLTTNEVFGIGSLEGHWVTIVPVFFVIAGDLRYLLLRAWVQADGSIRPAMRTAIGAFLLSLLMPIVSQAVVTMADASNPRVLFLVYEAGFAGLVLTLHFLALPAIPWARRLDAIALGWYGCWIAADIMILVFEMDVGFVVRTAANLLYYGALPAVLAGAAPQRPTFKSTQ